jgi:hypothetical protein
LSTSSGQVKHFFGAEYIACPMVDGHFSAILHVVPPKTDVTERVATHARRQIFAIFGRLVGF